MLLVLSLCHTKLVVAVFVFVSVFVFVFVFVLLLFLFLFLLLFLLLLWVVVVVSYIISQQQRTTTDVRVCFRVAALVIVWEEITVCFSKTDIEGDECRFRFRFW